MADNIMDVDEQQPITKGKKEGKDSGKARFEVKKVREPEFLHLFTLNVRIGMGLTLYFTSNSGTQ